MDGAAAEKVCTSCGDGWRGGRDGWLAVEWATREARSIELRDTLGEVFATHV
jgi:hypothetical protein